MHYAMKKYGGVDSWSQQYMEVSGRLQAPSVLTPEIKPEVLMG
jgi:hypothetical protein